MALTQKEKQRIRKGREAVDAYRTAHVALHKKPWHRGVPEEHTPLLNIMLKALQELGFNNPWELFRASDELNMQELGFASREDFEARATEEDERHLYKMHRWVVSDVY